MLTADLELAREFVAANPPPGRLMLCAVSGAHMYGFPSADSDLDLKGIHLAPTRELLGLRPDVAVHDLTAWHRGVECDLTTNEAGAALALLLNGNGNMLERILSPLQLTVTDELRELQVLARASVSRSFVRHYAGFFRGCQREHEREATAKTMLYSYRVALTGIHLLRSGVLEPNLTVLAPTYGYDDVAALVALKQEGAEHGALPDDLDQHHRRRWPELEQALRDAEETSALPAEAPNADEIESWLISARLSALS
jgi:predicted nucleotidyltransferase